MKLPPDKIVNLVSHKAIIIYDLFGFRMTLARKRYLKPVFVLLFIKERQDCTFCACTLCAKKKKIIIDALYLKVSAAYRKWEHNK